MTRARTRFGPFVTAVVLLGGGIRWPAGAAADPTDRRPSGIASR